MVFSGGLLSLMGLATCEAPCGSLPVAGREVWFEGVPARSAARNGSAARLCLIATDDHSGTSLAAAALAVRSTSPAILVSAE